MGPERHFLNPLAAQFRLRFAWKASDIVHLKCSLCESEGSHKGIDWLHLGSLLSQTHPASVTCLLSSS